MKNFLIGLTIKAHYHEKWPTILPLGHGLASIVEGIHSPTEDLSTSKRDALRS